ncbi:hypothetical protein BJH93_03635 [Kocuria polaris]|nr:hypothetical protein [Kocuria polaris]
MSSVGLLYVGAVLCVNGLVQIGVVRPRGAIVLNFIVGTMQLVFPTILLTGANGDPGAILAASGLYLFGITYLWVGAIGAFHLPADGFGWFSLYVAVTAAVFGGAAVVLQSDPVAAAMWWLWAALWFLFFLLDALGRRRLRVPTGWFAIFCGVGTCTLPALLQLLGLYSPSPIAGVALGLAGAGVLAIALLLSRRYPGSRHLAAGVAPDAGAGTAEGAEAIGADVAAGSGGPGSPRIDARIVMRG